MTDVITPIPVANGKPALPAVVTEGAISAGAFFARATPIAARKQKLAQIIKLIDRGHSDREIAKIVGVTKYAVEAVRWQQRPPQALPPRSVNGKMQQANVIPQRNNKYENIIQKIADECSVAPSVVRKVQAKLNGYEPPQVIITNPPKIKPGEIAAHLRARFPPARNVEISKVARFLIAELVTLLMETHHEAS